MSAAGDSILADGPLACDELCAPLRERWLKLKNRPLNPCNESKWRVLKSVLDGIPCAGDLFLACQWIAFAYARAVVDEYDDNGSVQIIRDEQKSGERALRLARGQLDGLLQTLAEEWPGNQACHFAAAEGLRAHLDWLELGLPDWVKTPLEDRPKGGSPGSMAANVAIVSLAKVWDRYAGRQWASQREAFLSAALNAADWRTAREGKSVDKLTDLRSKLRDARAAITKANSDGKTILIPYEPTFIGKLPVRGG